MFFKKDKTELERKLDMGPFDPVPKDVMQHIVLLLDFRSLTKLAMTNSSFREIIFQLPKVHFKIYNHEFNGPFPEVLNLVVNYFEQEKRQESERALKKRREEIDRSRMALKELQDALDDWTAPSRSKHFSCVTDEERLTMGCCCVLGTVGGLLVSCFLPFPWMLSTCAGPTVAVTTSLTACRTAKCLCGACLSYKKERIDEKERNLDPNPPPTQITMRM